MNFISAKANPDDLIHEPSPLYIVSERTLRALVDGNLTADEAIEALGQDNFVEVEVMDRAKVDLLKPPF